MGKTGARAGPEIEPRVITSRSVRKCALLQKYNIKYILLLLLGIEYTIKGRDALNLKHFFVYLDENTIISLILSTLLHLTHNQRLTVLQPSTSLIEHQKSLGQI